MESPAPDGFIVAPSVSDDTVLWNESYSMHEGTQILYIHYNILTEALNQTLINMPFSILTEKVCQIMLSSNIYTNCFSQKMLHAILTNYVTKKLWFHSLQRTEVQYPKCYVSMSHLNMQKES